MEFNIRPFRASDYQPVLMIMKAAVPEVPVSEEELRNRYENRGPNIKFKRWVVVFNGNVVAYGFYDQSSQINNQKALLIYEAVHPDYQLKGIGSALYDRVTAALDKLNVQIVGTFALENKSRSIAFLKARGFREDQQDQHEALLFLNLASSSSLSYAEIEEKLQSQGFTIKTLKELQSDFRLCR